MKTTDLEDRIAKQERELRIWRRVQIALFILI